MKITRLALAVLMAAVVAPLTTPAAEPRKMNIVLIYGDDVGYGDLSCYGATAVQTPHCDRLAKEGLRFTSAYATSATCTPSRFSMLTGQYAFRQRGTGVLPGNAPLIIATNQLTLPSMLKKAGYATGVVGKLHLGLGLGGETMDWNEEIRPSANDIGFDHAFLMPATGDRVPCVYVENRRVINLSAANPLLVNYKTPFPGELNGVSNRSELRMDWSHGHNQAVINGVGRIGYMTGGTNAVWHDEEMYEVFARQAVQFIERHREGPFFLYFATHSIHVPRLPGKRFVGKTTMGPRGDAILEFDWQVGEVTKALDRLGLAENTLVIVSSDNGPVIDDGYKDDAVEKLGNHRAAGPLRGGKYSTFEGGTRMPFLVRGPGVVKAGVSDALVSQVDFIATFAALVGQKLPGGAAPDSQNILPALLGTSKKGRDHVLEQAGNVAIRVGDWKYIPPSSGARRNAATNSDLGNDPAGQLYNLAEDIGEKNNLAARHPEKVAELTARLVQLKADAASRQQAVAPKKAE